MSLRMPRFLAPHSAKVGLAMVAFVALVAAFGPVFAPHSPNVIVGAPAQPPGNGFLLGTDQVGRDVFSRLLNGGRSMILLAAAATALSYVIGLLIGMAAGYTRSIIDPILMRSVDLLLVLPALLLVLLAIVAFGNGSLVLVGAVALIQAPLIARVVRTATLEVAATGFVEGAVARGDSRARIFLRDLLPNIAGPVLADAGLRFTYSVLLIASVNFLGLGLAPPASDWSLMVAENREIISNNIWAVLAPSVMIALLTIGINLCGDALARSFGRAGATPGSETVIEIDPLLTASPSTTGGDA
jgi:peptide/nickel transport system permease protein